MKKIFAIVLVMLAFANAFEPVIKFEDCKTRETRLWNDSAVQLRYCGMAITCYEKTKNRCRHLAFVHFEITDDNDYAIAIRPIIPPDILDSVKLAEADSIAARGQYTEYHYESITIRQCIEWFTPHWRENNIKLNDNATEFDIPATEYCMSQFLPNDRVYNKKVNKHIKHNLNNYINAIDFKKFLPKNAL